MRGWTSTIKILISQLSSLDESEWSIVNITLFPWTSDFTIFLLNFWSDKAFKTWCKWQNRHRLHQFDYVSTVNYLRPVILQWIVCNYSQIRKVSIFGRACLSLGGGEGRQVKRASKSLLSCFQNCNLLNKFIHDSLPRLEWRYISRRSLLCYQHFANLRQNDRIKWVYRIINW